MSKESRESSRVKDDPRLERAIVLELLRDDRKQRWSRAELETQLDADRRQAAAVKDALRRLHEEGVLGLAEDAVWASRAARRLDELGLICV
jgi:hypothetical protein